MTNSRVPDLGTVRSPRRRSLNYRSISGGETIGSGGQAIVRRVELTDGSPDLVAIKEPLQPAETLTSDTVQQVLASARTWRRLDTKERRKQVFADSEYIVGVVDIGDELPWIAMEYMDGGSLADRLNDHPNGLPIDEALWIGECLCSGIKLAHDSGVAHLDVKPANVLFRETPGDTWNVPKIGDWGLARTLIEHSQSMNAYSVEYAAPEQFDTSLGSADKYTDIYQLGAVMYAMLTGRPPYTGGQAEIMHAVLDGDGPTPPSAHRDAIPDDLDEIVLTALSHSKSDRFQGEVGRLGDALRAVRTGKEQSGDDSVIEATRTTGSTESSTQPTTQTGAASRSTAESDAWPMFRQNPARTGAVRSKERSRDDTDSQSTVTERWHYEADQRFFSSPAVVDDTVYVGCDDYSLYALNATTGEVEWHYETNRRIRSSPAVVDDTVYVGSKDGNLYALDANTGEREWHHLAQDYVISSPAVVDGTVYFTSGNDNLYALDSDTGDEVWIDPDGFVASSPVVVDGTVYVGSHDGDLYALDATTGEREWYHETDARVRSSPAVLDGTVYVGDDGHLYAVDATTGERRWQNRGGVLRTSTPVIGDEHVYKSKGGVTAYDIATGEEQWQHTGGSVASADDTVYAGGDGFVHALDATTGDRRWQYEFDTEIVSPLSSLSVVDDTIYVGCDDGIRALALE